MDKDTSFNWIRLFMVRNGYRHVKSFELKEFSRKSLERLVNGFSVVLGGRHWWLKDQPKSTRGYKAAVLNINWSKNVKESWACGETVIR